VSLAKKGGIVLAGIVLVLAMFVMWIWFKVQVPENIENVTAAPRGDVTLSEFYAPPASLPDNPGALIRHEEMVGDTVLANAGQSFRVLYSSTEGLGGADRSVVSGALFLPQGEPPEGGWPLLVWSHGTVGIGDVCAPSFAGRSDRDLAYLNPWLEQGYAIAASDYQGLGTPGTHPYMDARTMAYNNLDLIRAVQASDFPLNDKVVVSGQSQGATGALATGSFAARYAQDVELGAVIATGIPHFSLAVVSDLISNTDSNEVSATLPLSLYMLAMTEMLDPDFKLDEIVTDKARPVVDTIGETCVFDFIGATTQAGLTSGNSFTSRPEFALYKTFSRAQISDLEFETPLFAGSGTLDKITPFSMQQAFVSDACDAGLNITAITYEGANHNEGLLQSTQDAQQFANAILAGESLESTCPG